MERDGDAVPYSELLGLARDDGLIGLDVQVTQAPGEANGRTAVVVAVARTSDGAFSAVGEASPASAPSVWHPFLTTLAELRAKARALRDLTGQGIAVQEELDVPYPTADDDDEGDDERGSARVRPVTAARDAPSGYQATRQPSPGVGSYNDNAPPTPTPTPVRPAPLASAASTPAAVQAQLQRLSIAAQSHTAPRRSTDDEGDDGADTESDEGAPSAPRYTPPATTTTTPSASAASIAPAASPLPRPDSFQTVPSNTDDEDEDEGEPDDEDEARDEGVDDSIDDDMRAKLMKLAISLAKLNGKDVTDAEAVQRLDAYFMRAFKRPLNRATRHEGQMAVSSLSKQLQTRRNAAGGE